MYRSFHQKIFFLCALFASLGMGLVGCGGSTEQQVQPDTAGCIVDTDCASSGPCQPGVCVQGACSSEVVSGLSCDDGNQCTEGSTCSAEGQCAGGSAIAIPSKPCQSCVCTPETGLECAEMPVGTSCSDGNCCTSNDKCTYCAPDDFDCVENELVCAGTTKNCDDDNACSLDQCACIDGNAECNHTPKEDGASCIFSDNDCTTGDSCQSGVCQPGEPSNLDDQNPCTLDLCVKGKIEHEPLVEGACDDGNECTISDRCSLGTCVGGAQVECDQPECAGSAACIPGQGCVPSFLPSGATCDDENPCTTSSICNAEHECVGASEIDCDDGKLCTTDSCDKTTGSCINQVFSGACDDSNQCTLNDNCNDQGFCVGNPVSCADNTAPCLQSVCNPESGICDLPKPDGTVCGSGDLCSGENTCMNGGCILGSPVDCSSPSGPCMEPVCNPETGLCDQPKANGASCSDGNPCTINDQCQSGNCHGPDPVVCELPSCAGSSTCIPQEGCVTSWLPAGATCDDENSCTEASFCTEDHECEGEITQSCDDADPCTVDSCVGEDGSCSNVIEPGLACDPTSPCETSGVCQADGSCVGTQIDCSNPSNPCFDDSCNPNTGLCNLPKADGFPCPDSDLCDGAETCLSGVCSAGDPVVCSDQGNPCIEPNCNPGTGLCDIPVVNYTPCLDENLCNGQEECINGVCTPGTDLSCDDGAFCNGAETCTATDGCVPGTPPPLDDEHSCTVGSCDEATDDVIQTPDDTLCDNQNACDGSETCTVADGCVPGTPIETDDQIDCTQDSCDPETGAVTNLETNSLCSEDLPCRNYFCDASQSGCISEIVENCCGNGMSEGSEECDDGNTDPNDGCTNECLVEWVLVYDHDLSQEPLDTILEQEVEDPGQGPSQIDGVPCWEQNSTWNALWIPHPDPNKPRTAVEVDVYRYPVGSIRVFSFADKTGYLQFDSFIWVQSTDNLKNVNMCSNPGTGGCQYLYYNLNSSLPANTWVKLRIEIDRENNLMSWSIDGQEEGLWTIDPDAIDGHWMMLYGTGVSEGIPKACWTNMKIYVQGGSSSP